MLSPVLAHGSPPLDPAELWRAWNLDPLVVLGLGLTAWAYHRGVPSVRPGAVRRTWCFDLGLGALAVALVSPLDALSGALASAHMVQHVLLVLVAAPLLVVSWPAGRLLRGSPRSLAGPAGRWRRRLLGPARRLRPVQVASIVWLAHVVALWLWHSSTLYDAALRDELLHRLEHASFLVTALLFWGVVLGASRSRTVPRGYGVLLVFAMTMQGVFLSALLTFASAPWYEAYLTTAPAWGFDPLADQQLAGVIMWVPAGAIYVGTALALLGSWIAETERAAAASAVPARRPVG